LKSYSALFFGMGFALGIDAASFLGFYKWLKKI